MLQKRGERDATRVHSGGVNAALVTEDGAVAVTLSKDCTARVWDLNAGTCTHVLVGESAWLLSQLLLLAPLKSAHLHVSACGGVDMLPAFLLHALWKRVHLHVSECSDAGSRAPHAYDAI